ncbi:MAG: PilW family protein [Desulfobacteraceae bacterium]|jgi:prepilin-type N-terminal cleavage/methylation domain-containing protein
MKQKKAKNQGFTLVELLVAMAIATVVLTAIFFTFKSQQDSYVVQSQVAMTQQNVRGAMQLISRDIQMAGYYTNFEASIITMNWDDMGADESMRPIIYARDNISAAGDDIKDNTDLIVIVKASMENGRQLALGEAASMTTASSTLRDAGNLTQDKYAVLVKNDLSRAEFFQVTNSTGIMNLSKSLVESYTEDDWIFRADIIIYYVDDADPEHPNLMRRNLGNNEQAQVMAEDIDNLQFRYVLDDGSEVDSGFNERDVRAVQIYLMGRTRNIIRGYTDPNTYNIGGMNVTPGDGYRRRLLKALIKTRNIGL